MNIVLRIFVLGLFIVAAGCQQKSGDDHDHGTAGNSENQALYDEVMQIHDEVMPKMDDLYKAKTALKTRITNNPGITESEKKVLNDKIALLDSAGEGMMIWMRQFNPLPDDSLGEDKAREYLKSEMQKVKKVKQDIFQALEETKSNTP